MRNAGNKKQIVLVFVLLFLCGMTGGYFLFTSGLFSGGEVKEAGLSPDEADSAFVKVYYPYGGRLHMEERKVGLAASRKGMAEVTLLEFLKGPAGVGESDVPRGVEVLGIYPADNGILYLDLSDEFRSDFQGDALAEFLLLRGLYESLFSNVYGIEGVKILIEGREVETLGGHISLIRPLGEVVSHTMAEGNEGR